MSLRQNSFAARSWDASSRELTYNTSDFDPKAREWIRSARVPSTAAPTEDELYEEFTERLTVQQDRKSGLVRVEFVHPSPEIASAWIGFLVADLNARMREHDIEEARRSIQYLEAQIRTTPLAELRAVFHELVQQQTETLMLAQVRPEYVFRFVDPPFVPTKPFFRSLYTSH